MIFITVIHHYLLWHYASALREMTHVFANLLWFTVNFFSLPQLSRSLLAPYRRITEERRRAFDLEDIAGFIIINLLSRLIGLMLRLTIIGLGLIALTILCTGIIITYVFWLTAPVVLLSLFLFGVRLLIM